MEKEWKSLKSRRTKNQKSTENVQNNDEENKK